MIKFSNGQIFIFKVVKIQNEDCCDLLIVNYFLNMGFGVDFVYEFFVIRRGVDWKRDLFLLVQVVVEEQ